MDKKQQLKEKLHSFKEWCKDIGGLVKENKTIAMSVVVFIALVAAAVGISTTIGKNTQSSEAAALVESTVAASETEEETL